MSMESKAESFGRGFAQALPPAILLVSIFVLGFTILNRIDALGVELEDKIAEASQDIQALDQDIQALEEKFIQMQLALNDRFDALEEQVAKSAFVAVPDAQADRAFIARFEKLMEGRYPTMEEFEGLKAQIEALQERRVR